MRRMHLVLVLLACLLLPAGTAAQSRDKDGLRPLEVFLNGTPTGTWPMLERGGELYAPADAFDEWRIQMPASVPAVLHRGMRYLPLAAVPGYNARIDYANLSMDLVFAPSAFAATQVARTLASAPVPDPVLPSGFFNYDLNLSKQTGRAIVAGRDLGMVGELGFSSSLGVLTSSLVGRNLDGGAVAGSPTGWTRLETTFTRDFPGDRRTLRLGDASTRLGLLGRSVYFGGVQLGTNLALTPGFISQPLPVMRGLSNAPSTVELYVNDVLRQVAEVPAGPFTLDNFPTVSGGGEARLVVRDILGRETVITQSFFASAQLLAPDLSDWSVEAGALRSDLGSVSDRYGPGFASGTWRHGLTNALTLESRAERTGDLTALGLGAIAALPGQVLGRGAWMASDEQLAGRGDQWLLGFDRQWERGYFAVQTQGATPGFRQLGLASSTLPVKRQLAANASYTTRAWGSVGLGFAQTQRYDSERLSTITASHSLPLAGYGRLSLIYSRALDGATGSSLGLTLTLPLDRRSMATAALQRRAGQTDGYAAVSRNPEQDGDLGWRVQAGRQGQQVRSEGSLQQMSRFGNLSAYLSASADQQALRLGASGGLVVAEGHLFATRRVDQSFALVEVAGYGDVGVGLGHAMQTRTNGDGLALLPRLQPYQTNSVRLNAGELPINAEIGSIEQIAVPMARSAVKVVFPVRSGRGALLKIVFQDGEPAPAGATVRIEGDAEAFYVARRGEAYVTGLKPSNRVRLSWKDRHCLFEVALPPERPDQIDRIGPLSCQGVER